MKGFIEFIREQGVMGLAVGFILGGSVKELVTSLVNDLVNPLVGIFLGRAGELKKIFLQIGPARSCGDISLIHSLILRLSP